MQRPEDALEEALHARIAPVQMDPLGDAETQDGVVLLPLGLQHRVFLQDKVGLREETKERLINLDYECINFVFQGSVAVCPSLG